jgi:hypothetical protein
MIKNKGRTALRDNVDTDSSSEEEEFDGKYSGDMSIFFDEQELINMQLDEFTIKRSFRKVAC